MQPDFIGAVFDIHEQNLQKRDLAHGLRQLLLLLCSLTGPIFWEKSERQLFSHFLCDGTHKLLSLLQANAEPSLIYDAYTLIARLVANFRLKILSELPSFIPLLRATNVTGTALLRGNFQECKSVAGYLDSTEHAQCREEALSLLLEDMVLLCQDQWLNDSQSDENSRKVAHLKLTQTLGPLYSEFIRCRARPNGVSG
jgi:hypothetical protein